MSHGHSHAHHHGHSHAHFHVLPADALAERSRLMRFAGTAAILVALTLVVGKTVAWAMTGSLSILSSGVDSLLDVAASGLNFLAIRYALVPPDKEHRFGHGKAEDIAGLAQAMFIAGSGLFIFIEGAKRLMDPPVITQESVGLWVMGASMALTTCLVLLQRYVVRKTNSVAVQADSLHYVTDLLSNGGVILALVLSAQFGWNIVDPIIAFVIAGYIFYSAWQIGFGSFHNLMDHEFPTEERQRIIAIATAQPGVLGMHELKTRRSGMHRFVQMHLGIDETLTLKEAHAIAEAVEERIMREFPLSDVLIHEDPVEKKTNV